MEKVASCLTDIPRLEPFSPRYQSAFTGHSTVTRMFALKLSAETLSSEFEELEYICKHIRWCSFPFRINLIQRASHYIITEQC